MRACFDLFEWNQGKYNYKDKSDVHKYSFSIMAHTA